MSLFAQTSSRTLLAVVLTAFILPACPSGRLSRGPARQPEPQEQRFEVHFFGDSQEARARRYLTAAKLAAQDVNNEKVLSKPLLIVEAHGGDPAALAGLVDDEEVIGAVVVGGRAMISGAAHSLDASRFPVVELADDLYESGEIRSSVFQMSTPHSWESWRLARYFGPGDRNFRKVGLLRGANAEGEIAASAMGASLAERNLSLVDAGGLPSDPTGVLPEALEKLSGADAVVVDGATSFVEPIVAALSREPRAFKGRSKIHEGWRPQVAGFSTLTAQGVALTAGTVATGDYARASSETDSISRVRTFRQSLEKFAKTKLAGDEGAAYDAVRALAEATARAGGTDRAKLTAALESFDRVAFSRLPLSFGPTDHVGPERDHLGLWAVNGSDPDPWAILHRTFTSDLERTNLLEEDWPSFFDGTTPGGEAPFYFTAKHGIVTKEQDDLH